MSLQIRTINSADWPAIMATQQECYVDIAPEPLEVMQSKWHVAPKWCFVIEEDKKILGYVLAHPWQKGCAPKLDVVLDEETPQVTDADCLYLHDMAISPDAQGKGVAGRLISHLLSLFKNDDYKGIGLIAIQNAASFWQHQGFKPFEQLSKTLAQSLSSYTDDACYLFMDKK